jgi:hypothetical protein
MNHLAWKHVKYGDKSNFFRSLIIVIERTKSNSLNDKNSPNDNNNGMEGVKKTTYGSD